LLCASLPAKMPENNQEMTCPGFYPDFVGINSARLYGVKPGHGPVVDAHEICQAILRDPLVEWG
jgi:hypothetical protein